MKRFFDIIFSFTGLIVLFPFFFFFSILIVIDSGFPVFYLQKRVGKGGKDFTLFKFRTMKKNADQFGLLTVGEKDTRITAMGYFLRKYKIDELPQLFNVLKGDMSLVGPRPEVRKYVEMYSEEQKKVLSVKPGITDYASIKYSHENAMLEKSENPEQFYVNEVMPSKIELNLKYILEQNFFTDIKILLRTVLKIFR